MRKEFITAENIIRGVIAFFGAYLLAWSVREMYYKGSTGQFFFVLVVFFVLVEGIPWNPDKNPLPKYYLRFADYTVLGLSLVAGGVVKLSSTKGLDAGASHYLGMILVVCGEAIALVMLTYNAYKIQKYREWEMEEARRKAAALETDREILAAVNGPRPTKFDFITGIVMQCLGAAVCALGTVLAVIAVFKEKSFLYLGFAVMTALFTVKDIIGVTDMIKKGYKNPAPKEKKTGKDNSLTGIGSDFSDVSGRYSDGDISEEEYSERIKDIINK